MRLAERSYELDGAKSTRIISLLPWLRRSPRNDRGLIATLTEVAEEVERRLVRQPFDSFANESETDTVLELEGPIVGRHVLLRDILPAYMQDAVLAGFTAATGCYAETQCDGCDQCLHGSEGYGFVIGGAR